MMRHAASSALLLMSVVAFGCTVAPDEPGPARSTEVAPRTAPAAISGGVESARGYRHTAARSRFKPGSSAQSVFEWGLEKTTGAEGVFAVAPENGAAWASSNGTAPAMRRKAFSADAAHHDARVRQYFVDCGLPADQIGGVHAATLTQGVGPTQAKLPTTLVAWYSALGRVVRGVPVVDSVAWARVNEDDDVVAESVYRPEIDGSVIADAIELHAKVADPTRAASYLASLPPEAKQGRVVIRHSSSISRNTPFVALASLDVQVRARNATFTRHFDLSGAERRLPQEQAPANVRVDARKP